MYAIRMDSGRPEVTYYDRLAYTIPRRVLPFEFIRHAQVKLLHIRAADYGLAWRRSCLRDVRDRFTNLAGLNHEFQRC